jgi:transposase
MNQQERWNIVSCIQRGMTYDAIHKEFGYARTTISRWWQRYCETGGVEDAPRSGRPLKLTDA